LNQERIIVALDVDKLETAVKLVQQLRDYVGAFKVGLELVNSAGLPVFDKIRDAGAKKIFYDAKLHDIPNTVAGAARAAVRLGVWAFNVHCSGGFAMMKAAKDAVLRDAGKLGVAPSLVLGVTLLTSIDQQQLRDELSIPDTVNAYVERMARMAQAAGLDGVVASPQEIKMIRSTCGKNFVVVTPGVRPAGAEQGDQKRVMTPEEAVSAGADYIVIGRPITQAADARTAARDIAATLP